VHKNSRLLFEKYALRYFSNKSKVLEMGPAGDPTSYEVLAPHAFWYTAGLCSDVFRGLNTELNFATIDGVKFPGIERNAFDIVVSGQVLEHVEYPWLWFAEIARIVRRGGYVITTVPISWKYHEAPIDCWRIYPDGMKALHHWAGLKTILAVVDCLDGDNWDTIAVARKGQ